MSENITANAQEELNELLQIRRDKLAELQGNGNDPFKITKFDRTHTSKDICEGYTTEERTVTVRGEALSLEQFAKLSNIIGKHM